MSRFPWLPVVLSLCTLAACTKGEGDRTPLAVEVPAVSPAAEPSLTEGADGHVYLSWVEEGEAEHRLRVSRWEGAGWSSPREVARGDDWFVNWADVPGLAVTEKGAMAAAWLARLEGGPYAYGVRAAVSPDGGGTWSEPLTPHRDGTATEHGFVSLVPLGGGTVGLAWLDGRETGNSGEDGSPGPMTLRFTTLDREGHAGEDVLLDDRVCDCCPTDAARLADGTLLVVYRDRSEDEVRDTSLLRREGGTWGTPVSVHEDGWRIEGCPVNGPRVAVDGDRVAVAWFTAPGEEGAGEVRLAFSRDAGRTFEEPVRVDGGNPLGRQDVVLLPGGPAWVVWLEDTGDGRAEVRLREIGETGPAGPGFPVGTTASSRSSGFPRIARSGTDLLVAWTGIEGDSSRVRSALVR